MHVSKRLLWALMSAAFAALTATLSKLGLRHVNPDIAQQIRTAVVMGAVVALNVGRTSWAGATALSQENWKHLILAGSPPPLHGSVSTAFWLWGMRRKWQSSTSLACA